MPRFRSRWLLISVLLIFALALSACLGGSDEDPSPTPRPSNPSVTPINSPIPRVASPTPLPTLAGGSNPTPFAGFPTAASFPTQPPIVQQSIQIISPTTNATVQGNVTIFGSASHPNFVQYALEYGPQNNPSNLWYPITPQAITVPVVNSALGAWNTTTVPDGTYQIRLHVYLTGGSELTNTLVSSIKVRNSLPTNTPQAQNSPPTISPIAPFNIQQGTSATVALGIIDPDGDTFSFNVATDNATVLTVSQSGQSMVVSGIAPGAATVTLTATDARGASNSTSVVVRVVERPRNDNPPNIAPISGQTLQQNTAISIPLTITDSDGDAVTFTAISGNTAILTVNTIADPANLVLSALSPGSTTVTVTAADSRGLETSAIFSVVVNPPAPANNAPSLGTISSVTLDLEKTVNIPVSASDPDGDTLTLSTSINPEGVIAFQQVTLGFMTIRAIAAGSTTVTVTVDDGNGGTASTLFTVTVNAPPPVNQSPKIEDLPAITLEVGQSQEIDLVMSDPDGDPIQVAAVSEHPAIATPGLVDADTINVTAHSVGTTIITIAIGDGRGGSDVISFNVTGTAPIVLNRNPAIVDIGSQTVEVGQSLVIGFTATDPDGDSLTITASTEFTNIATIFQSSATELTIQGVDVGATNGTVTVSDGRGGTDFTTFTITISASPNKPPVIQPIVNQTCDVSETLTIPLVVSDPDGDPFGFDTVTSSNAGIALVNYTGLSSIDVVCVAPGTVTITVSITDGQAVTDTSFITTVNAPTATPTSTNAPTATDIPPSETPLPTSTDAPTITATFTEFPTLTDLPTETETVTETPTATFTDVPFEEKPSETPTEIPTDVAPTETFTETPTEIPTDVPPTETFTETPTETSTDVPPTETFTETPTETPTDVPPTETFTETPTETSTDVPPTETFTETPTETPTDVPPTETFTETPTETSTDVPPTETFTETPTEVPNQLPIIALIDPQILNVGDAVAVPVGVSDPDGDLLTISASSDNPALVTAAWNPATTTVDVTGVAAGLANVTVIADDGRGGVVNTSFSVTVNALNQNPTIAPIAPQILNVGDAVAVPVGVSDPDGDPLTISASSDNPALVTAAWNPATTTVDVTGVAAGLANVTVIADDGRGGVVNTSFSVTVNALNQNPTIAPIAPQILNVGDAVAVPVGVSDPDGDPLTISASSDNPALVTAAWNPATTTVDVTGVAAGLANVTVIADDGRGGVVNTSFNVTVNALNQNPTIAPIDPQILNVGDVVAVPVGVSDPDGDPLTISASSDNPALVTAAWNPATTTVDVTGVAAGLANVTVTADDGRGGVVNTSFNVTVNALNQNPTIAPIVPQTLNVGDALAVPVGVSDPDGDPLTINANSDNPALVTAAWNPATTTVDVTGVAAGSANVTVTADDGRGGVVNTSFSVTVNALNQNPTIAPIAPQILNVGDVVAVPVGASDPDGDPLTISASSDNPALVTAAWNPATTTVDVTGVAAGSANVTVTADDGRGGLASTSFAVTVNAPEIKPTDPPPPSGIDLNAVPVLPDLQAIAPSLLPIYNQGINLGNRDTVVAFAGDDLRNDGEFTLNALSPIAQGTYNLGEATNLQGVIDHYTVTPAHDVAADTSFAGSPETSFAVRSAAVGDGWNSTILITPLAADTGPCLAGETPLACELRLARPSVVIVSFMPVNATTVRPEQFAADMQQIVNISLTNGTIPVLVTMPEDGTVDSATLNAYNQTIVKLAIDNNLPLYNLYRDMQQAPLGIYQIDGTGSTDFSNEALQAGINRRNVNLLRVLNRVSSNLFRS